MSIPLYWPNAVTEDGQQLFTYDAALTMEKALYQFFIWDDMGYKIKSAYIQGPGGKRIDLRRTTNPWIVETAGTNADRIRAMSDGELAKFMVRNTCAVYSSPEDCDYSCDGFETCYDSWLVWLQSPADGGDKRGITSTTEA